MPVRRATRADIPIMTGVLAASFGPDPMFKVMFPHRYQYPDDFLLAMQETLWLSWYDYKKVLMVSYEETNQQQLDAPAEDDALLPKTVQINKRKEAVTGMAEWERQGKGWENVNGVLGWWDPRHLMKPLLSAYYTLRRKLCRNRASVHPTPSNPNPLMYYTFVPMIIPYIAHFFDAPHRRTHWSLEILAIHPDHQGKGHGKELVLDGLERARTDPEGELPACVVAADGKETFYQKCGFKELVGWASRTTGPDGSDNPLRSNGVGGGAVLWTR